MQQAIQHNSLYRCCCWQWHMPNLRATVLLAANSTMTPVLLLRWRDLSSRPLCPRQPFVTKLWEDWSSRRRERERGSQVSSLWWLHLLRCKMCDVHSEVGWLHFLCSTLFDSWLFFVLTNSKSAKLTAKSFDLMCILEKVSQPFWDVATLTFKLWEPWKNKFWISIFLAWNMKNLMLLFWSGFPLHLNFAKYA